MNPTYYAGDVIEITVTSNASVVNVTINGKVYPITNNKVTIPADETAAGKYIVTATVYENDKFMANTTTEQFEIIKHKSEVNVTADPIKVGETAVINITAPDYNGYAIVNINGNDYSVAITNGFGQLNITGFGSGTYPVSVTYLENAKYNQSTNGTTLEVSKEDSFVNVIPKQISVGENEVIIFNVPTDATGNITVIVDDETYSVAVSGGKGTLTIEGLNKGEYRVNATYNGDGKYAPSVNNTQMFKVIYQSTEMKVVDEKNGTVIVYLHDNATGNVSVEVDGEVYNATVSNGVAVVTLNNTAPGNHTAHVIYSGDGEFNSTEAFVEVTVPKYSSSMNITVSEFKVGETGYINVTLPENATGTVTVKINGKTYNTTDIRDGVATFEIGNLTAGDKTFVVKYSGDRNYEANSTVTTLTVDKLDSSISVAGDEINVGEAAQISITGPADIDGVVVVNVNGVNYTVILKSGNGSVDVSNLANGTYFITATYLENDKYKQSLNDSAVIVVSKVLPAIEVSVENISFGENAVFEITLPGDVTGNVTIKVSDSLSVTAGVIGGLNRIIVDSIPVGEYSVNVTYNGNDRYLKASRIVTLDVGPEVIKDGVVIEDFGNGTVVVHIPGNASGNVTVSIGGNNYTAGVENGTAVITLDNETPGAHDVSIIYSGDATHDKVVINTTIALGKYSTPVHIDVTDSPVGEAVRIVVTTPENSTGVIFIEIDGVRYNETLTDGEAVFNIENLTAGVKTVIAIYEGDDNYLANSTTDKFTVYKIDSSISVAGDEINVGEAAQISITGPADIDGVVVVNVNGVNYTAILKSGNGSVDVSNLANGTYVITATYLENDRYKQSVNDSAIITVSKVLPAIEVSVENITYGENAVFEITLPDDATGNVTIKITDSLTVTAGVTGGLNRIIVDNIPVGEYSVNVTYNGNGKYLKASGIVSLDVGPEDISEGIVIEDFGNGTVAIHVPENVTGNITVDINGNKHTSIIENGTAIITLDNETPGVHDVSIIYSGDATHDKVVINTTIALGKYSTPVHIDVTDSPVGEAVRIVVTTPENSTGVIFIEIDGVRYNETLTDGEAVFNIENLTAGVKTVIAIYEGDDNYLANSTTDKFTVYKIDSSISVAGDEINVGEAAQISITGPADIDGVVVVNVNGVNYTAILKSGNGSVDVSNLANGTYVITATYLENDRYKQSVNDSAIITVSKVLPAIEVSVENITYSENAVFEITLPGDVTGNVTIKVSDSLSVTAGVTGGLNRILIDNVPVGEYSVNVTYNGNDRYLKASGIASLKVSPEDIKDGIKVDDLGNGTVIIHVPDNATGNITIDVGGETYTANIENGTAVITLTNETPGNYDVTLIYSGDETHGSVVIKVPVSLDKYTTPLTIDVNDTFVGKEAVITVTAPQNITGKIFIEINGVKYNKTATDGKAVFNITNLTAGVKTVVATYGGDDSYESNSTTAMFEVFKNTAPISIEVTPTADAVIKVLDLPDDATGYVIVNIDGKDYAINVTSSREITIPLKAGTYTATATYLGDGKYLSNETCETFTVNKTSADVEIEVDNTTTGSDVVVKVTVPDDATGNVTVTIGNITKVVNVTGGENVITVPGVGEGTYEVNVTYSGDDHYGSKTVIKYVTISPSIITPSEHLTRGWDSPYDYQAEFFDKNGNILANTDVQFIVDGKTYTVKTDSEGIAYLTDSHLGLGTYNVTVVNPVTGQQVTNTLTIVKRLVENKDITMDFADGHSYTVRVIGDDGNPVGEGEFISISVNHVEYPCRTDKDGYARLKINLNPGKFTITAEYKNFKVSNKLVVKQTLKLVKKTVKVKKGKKLVLKAKLQWTLKSNKGKSLKGKKIVFKFKGKTYKAKTNKKGIAKVTIKSKVTKKLKKGKKYTYTAKYLKNTVKGKVKIK